jgi:hypothetical protein
MMEPRADETVAQKDEQDACCIDEGIRHNRCEQTVKKNLEPIWQKQ